MQVNNQTEPKMPPEGIRDWLVAVGYYKTECKKRKVRKKKAILYVDSTLSQRDVDIITQQFKDLAWAYGYSTIEFMAALAHGEIAVIALGNDDLNNAIRLLDRQNDRTLRYITRELRASRTRRGNLSVWDRRAERARR